jgi:L-lactate dehydrogenase (cytochrome)
MLSNHGGRQLDGTGAPLDYLPRARDRIGSAAQLIVDGGVRRGVHVLKAVALGADACSIGRPYLYGLAAGGEAGVRRVLSIFRSEIERSMALMGKTRLADISRADIDHRSQICGQLSETHATRG